MTLQHQSEVVLGLVVAVAALVLLARRVRVAYPILLVLGGVLLGYVPHVPRVQMDPELVFLVFLPPLLYWESVNASWRDFQHDLRPISLLAIGLVLASTVIIAAVAHATLGMAWPPAIVLGALIAPTDEVAVAEITERLALPRRVVTLVEEESLVNDAVSLVIYRVAVGIIVTGVYSLTRAVGQFFLVSLGGIAVGVVIGALVAWIRRHMPPDPPVENTISLLTPFLAYLPAEGLGVSGVLAVVAAGLYMGQLSPHIVAPRTRLQAISMWEMIDFLLNGLLFLLVGLQLHPILLALAHEPVIHMSLPRLVGYAALVSFVAIVVRMVWVFPATYLPRLLSPSVRKRDPAPSWRAVALLGWTGIRGGTSLAAALAIPLTLGVGAPFPHRDLMIFLTFGSIVATLVLQGLSLPPLIRALDLKEVNPERREEATARLAAARAALAYLDNLEGDSDVPGALVDDLRSHYENRRKRFAAQLEGKGRRQHEVRSQAYRQLQRDLLAVERRTILGMFDEGQISDDVLRRVQHDLDLQDARLATHEEER